MTHPMPWHMQRKHHPTRSRVASLAKITLLVVCTAMTITGARAQPPQAVRIPTAALSNAPQALNGFLFSPSNPTPATAAHAPQAAIVMLHGCGGATTRSGNLNARHQMWGEHLAAQGYHVLMLDSFTARGVAQLCTTAFRQRTLKEADRVGDAYAALRYLQQQPGIDPTTIGLLGWSHGGGVVLHAIGQTTAPIQPGFAAAVAFYPGCTTRSAAPERFHPSTALLVLMGESDDWTPAPACAALTAAVQQRGEPMDIVLYPNTYHDFDNPSLHAPKHRRDVPNGATPEQGVTIAPNPVAREDALRRVSAFFQKHLVTAAGADQKAPH